MSENNTQQLGAEPVEVVDVSGRLLGVVSAAEAHRQSLPHRAVLVLFFNRCGKLLLGKRPKTAASFPGRWDLTARGHIVPGEASLDTAKRLADSEFPGINGLPFLSCQLTASVGTDFEALTVYKYRVDSGYGLPGGELLEVSTEELLALAQDFRELFAPAVIYALEKGILA
jgi:isopentenyl-diphosphate Delta-isomerase